MLFKTFFQQDVSGVETVEVVIEADNKHQAYEKFILGDYKRYLVVGRELYDTTRHSDPVSMERI